MSSRILGAEKLKRRIATIRSKLPELMTDSRMEQGLLERTRKRYVAQQKPDGGKWRELSPFTRKGGAGILRKTDSLFDALDIIRGTGTGFASATGAGFRIGVRDVASRDGGKRVAEYGRAHQLGRGRPGQRLPARQFLGINRGDIKYVDNYLRRKLRRLLGE